LYKDRSSSEKAQIQFQIFDLRFAINLKTGMPDLVGLGLTPFSCDQDPPQSPDQSQLRKSPSRVPESYKQSILSLLIKLDRQVRKFNGMRPSDKSDALHQARVFSQFWHVIVDADETDGEAKHDHKIK